MPEKKYTQELHPRVRAHPSGMDYTSDEANMYKCIRKASYRSIIFFFTSLKSLIVIYL